MKTTENTRARPNSRSARVFWKLMPLIVVTLLLLIFLMIPVYLSSGSGHRLILSKINQAVPGRADFSDLSMGWLKGVRIADFSFSDVAGQISVQAEEVSTKPRYAALLSGDFALKSTTINRPRIEINMTGTGTKPSKTSSREEPAAIPSQPATLAVVTNLLVNDGSVKITDAQARSVELSQINSTLNLRPPGQQSTMLLDMAVAGTQSTIHVAGQATPAKSNGGWKLADTDGELTVEISDLALESLEPILSIAGIELEAAGNLSANLKGRVKDSKIENLSGNVDGKQIDVLVAALAGDRIKTSSLTADVDMRQQGDKIIIDNVELKSDWANIKAKGEMPRDSSEKPQTDYEFSGTFDCDVAALMSQMPNTLALKEGTQVTSGRLAGNITASAKAGKRQIKGKADLTNLKGIVDGKDIALSQPIQATADITADESEMTFDVLNISAPFAKIDCTGTTKKLKYTADVDLAKFQSELGSFLDTGLEKMAGLIHEEGRLAVDGNSVKVSGSGYIQNLALTSKEARSITEPKADVKYTLDIDRDAGIAKIADFATDASFGRLAVREGVVPISKEAKVSTHMLLAASQIDLVKLRPFAVMFASFPEDLKIAGLANGDVSLDSEDNVYAIKTDNTKIDNFKLQSKDNKPFEQDQVTLEADVKLMPDEKTYSIKKLELLSPQIKVKFKPTSLKTSQGQTTLTGNADLDYDWDAVSSLASNVLPEELRLKGRRTTSVAFASTWPEDDSSKLLENLTTERCTLGFESAEYMGLVFGPTDVNAIVQNGELTIEPFETTVNEGKIEFAATADFKQKPTILKTPNMVTMDRVNLNTTVSNRLLAYVNPIFADAVNVSGVASFAAQRLSIPLGGSAPEKIDIDAALAIEDLRLEATGFVGELFSLMGHDDPSTMMMIKPTRLTVRDGTLKYDDMQVDVGNNPVNFAGAVGLKDKRLNMDVTLPYTFGGKTTRVGRQSDTRRVSLPLTGTITDPQLDRSKLPQRVIEGLIESIFDRL